MQAKSRKLPFSKPAAQCIAMAVIESTLAKLKLAVHGAAPALVT